MPKMFDEQEEITLVTQRSLDCHEGLREQAKELAKKIKESEPEEFNRLRDEQILEYYPQIPRA